MRIRTRICVIAAAVALARSTVPDACAGLPDGGFASEIPDLGLFEPRGMLQAGRLGRLPDAGVGGLMMGRQ